MNSTPCYCGADDCRSCHPENFEITKCDVCKEEMVIHRALFRDWVEAADGTWFCPECLKELDGVDLFDPSNFDVLECCGCGESKPRWKADKAGWLELEEDIYCDDCIAELERVSKEDQELVLKTKKERVKK